MIEWDEAKRLETLTERGLDFADLVRFDHANALVVEDTRFDYGEVRYQALGMLDGKLVMVVYTPRGENRRIISLRRAKPKERKIYDQYRQAP
jgi:uncharacterized DUF497 family protein